MRSSWWKMAAQARTVFPALFILVELFRILGIESSRRHTQKK
jgi:hypothetical protein